jgi:excisionase family DNA binding protein
MPRLLSGIPYYTVSEVAKAVNVHRITLLRWIGAGKVPDGRRDRNGWRLFSAEQLERIKDFALATEPAPEESTVEQISLFHSAANARR